MNKKKIIKIILVFLIFGAIYFFKQGKNIIINADSLEQKVYCEATLEDNFADDTIVVTLSNPESLLFKEYNVADFAEINCAEIEDLTEQTSEIVRHQIIAEQTGDWNDLESRKNNNMLVDVNSFHRVLCLKLSNANKEIVLDSIKILEQKEYVLSAEPDYIGELQMVPNNTNYNFFNQWGMNEIKVENAWNFSVGSPSVLVGVLDTGIDGSHPDLIDSLNADLHRDYVGAILPEDVKELTKFEITDPTGHGTHVAGIIGAKGNNNLGIAGVVWDVKLVSLRVINRFNFYFNSDVKRAIDFATQANIQILNFSAGGRISSYGLKKAIENYPGLFVCAAGNEGSDNDARGWYPANHNFDNIISVGAADANGKANFSNYGLTSVDIFAPGVDILSTYPLNLCSSLDSEYFAMGYYKLNGTSMAAPFVTGVAALMLSINPNLTSQELKYTILNNTTSYGLLSGYSVSNGILDAYKSISAVALSSQNIGGTLMIEGFSNENLKSFCQVLEIPYCYSPISDVFGTNQCVVQYINAHSFMNNINLKMIILPDDVISIGISAFEGCTNVEDISLPNALTTIGSYAFTNCIKAVSITLPNTIISIGESAFEGCENLESIALPSSLTSIGSNAFKGCSSLTELVIPNSVTTMGNSILSDCFDITELTIPYLNTHMGELFGLDNYIGHSNPKIQLKTLTISGGGIIPDYAFYNFYSLENIYLPNTITSIGSKAFYNGNIGSIELPESLVSIGDYAFYDCNKLTNIVIPNSVETIGNNAFEWCDELTTVEIQKDTTPITSIGVNVFNYCLELENIIVPMSKILKYKNANNWSNYSNKISYDDVAEGMYVMYVNCYSDISEDEELQSRKSIVYELNVDCVKEYNIICSTTEELVVYLYDSNMELSGIYPTYSNSNHTATFITELPLGIYYLEISYSDYQKSGSISTTISPSNGSIHHTKTTGMTSILPHLHKVSSNTYKAQFSFTPTYKTGLHKLSLSGTTSSGSNIVFGSGSISVYDNLSKITPMYQYSMLGLDNLAVSGGKEILVYLEKNETYYIDVTLSSNQYSALNLQILTYFNCEIGAADLPPYDISIMSNNKSYGSDLCEFILHDAMDFTVTIEGLTEGKFIIYQEVINEEGIISYSLVKEESFTGYFTDSFSLEAGSYYIGYIDAITSDDMNYDIMRIVVD